MTFKIIDSRLTEDVAATNGTTTVAYPAGTNAGTFTGAVGNTIYINGALLTEPYDFTVTYGTASITLTNLTATAWKNGWEYYLELQTPGVDGVIDGVNRAITASTVYINLGAPDTADPNGIAETQAVDISEAQTVLDGALVVDGIAVFDVPRNVVAAWTNTAVLTVTGTDEYGVTVRESSGSGTSMAGKKAFKTVTSATFSADVTGVTVGSGDVLGLPMYLPSVSHVIREMQDATTPTAGTLVAGVLTKPSATTGDVRGTYDPNAACDGEKVFRLIAVLPDPTFKGLAQYGG